MIFGSGRQEDNLPEPAIVVEAVMAEGGNLFNGNVDRG
jgi:hypothetical protein